MNESCFKVMSFDNEIVTIFVAHKMLNALNLKKKEV